MLGRTHIAVGLAAYVLATKSFHPAELAIVSVASKLPDVDMYFNHRSITHSLVAMAGLGYFARVAYPNLVIPVMIGYASHLILDSLTPMGVPWLWPRKRRYKIPLFKTGSAGEAVIKYAALLILLVLAILKVVG